jgi:uncharacterized lipoprotein YehR (DUF1307 family)
MKKKYILTSIALSLLLSFMLLSCNADATAGLFRQISNASAPVGIVYKQIVGLDTTAPKTLYFLTDEGLYKKSDGSISTKLVANEEGEIIQTAYYDKGVGKVIYQTNDNTGKIYSYDLASNTKESIPISDFSAFVYVKLLPNGLVLTGDSSNNFDLYNYTTLDSAVVSIPTTLSEYDLGPVLQLSGKKHTSLSENPMLISFVNESGGYKHFYITGSTATELDSSTSGMRFTAISVANNILYLMELDDSEGVIYKANNVADAVTTNTTFTKIHETALTYGMYAFMYGYYDSANSVTKLITKPAGINDALYEINIDASGVTARNVDDGYGKYLDAAEIKDSYEKDAGKLLVATSNNGMFEINLATNTSSSAENYTLD